MQAESVVLLVFFLIIILIAVCLILALLKRNGSIKSAKKEGLVVEEAEMKKFEQNVNPGLTSFSENANVLYNPSIWVEPQTMKENQGQPVLYYEEDMDEEKNYNYPFAPIIHGGPPGQIHQITPIEPITSLPVLTPMQPIPPMGAAAPMAGIPPPSQMILIQGGYYITTTTTTTTTIQYLEEPCTLQKKPKKNKKPHVFKSRTGNTDFVIYMDAGDGHGTITQICIVILFSIS